MIKTKKRGSLIIISGTTCAGKGTIVKELISRNANLYLSTSYTSRPIRNNEIDGKDYYFVDYEAFAQIFRKIAICPLAELHAANRPHTKSDG